MTRRGSDRRHDGTILKYGRKAAEGRRTGNAEQQRIGERVVRHVVEVSKRQHPPASGGRTKGDK